MSGLGLILSIARDALAAQRYALDVTAHNIANVNTPGYSRQSPVYEAKQSASYRGLQLGRGVDIDQVLRSTDQFIENRLMQEKSRMLSSSEMENYMQVLEGLFNETSETSTSTMLADFWNLWHDISNNPSGASERIALYEHSSLLSEQFNTLDGDLRQLETELTNAVSAGIDEINQITNEVAQLNYQIIGMEISNNTANDLRDTRNTLISELSEYIDVKTFEQDNGSLTVFAARGCILVHENSSYDLELGGDNGDRVKWQGSGNTTVDITDYTTKGKLGGWLDMRDEVIAKYKLDLDAVAKEFIWAVNQQQSQGVGLKLFSTEVTGTHKTGSSGLLSTLAYGNKIDYTKDFKMWIEDSSVTPGTFSAVAVDMGISTSAISNWAGTAPAAAQYKYIFTVTNGGAVGTDVNVTEANGAGLGEEQTAGTVSSALDKAIAAQTITVTGGSYGTQIVKVADSGGDATRSAKDIADALDDLNGVKAYASRTSAAIGDLVGLANTQDGDEVSFILDVEGITSTQTFTVDSSVGTLQAQFETAISAAVTAINSANSDSDLTVNGLTITSASGGNIGIQNFDVGDKSTITMGTFDNFDAFASVILDTSAFGDFALETISITVQGEDFDIHLAGTDLDGANDLSAAFFREFNDAGNAAVLAAAEISVVDNTGSFTIASTNETVTDIVLTGGTGDTGNDATLALSAGNGKTASTLGDNTFSFTVAGTDAETWSVTNEITFDIGDGTNTDSITVDLTGIDTSSATAMASAFNTALSGAATVQVVGFSDGVDTSLTLRQTRPDRDLTFDNTGGDLGTDATMALTAAAGTTSSGDQTLTWVGGADSEVFQSALETDTITFAGATVTETGGAGDDSAVVTGTITIFLDPDLSIKSSVDGTGTDGGLFNVAADTDVTLGKSIVTLGGDGGFTNFDNGDTISFDVDGTNVTYTVVLADDTDIEFATKLETALGGLGATYSISRNGASVSILKTDGTAIEITNFDDDVGNDATLAVSTGTGIGTTPPANALLDAINPSATSTRLFGSEGVTRGYSPVISWEKLDATGAPTGTSGSINVAYTETVVVEGTLSFDIGAGALVAGNTFTINTDSTGVVDPLSFIPSEKANSILDTYKFTVTSGGEIGTDTVDIKWSNSITSGTFTLEGAAPGTVEVDGMTIQFTDGTLFDDDVFTITTDDQGSPTENLPSYWHWTLDSFTDQFNRQTSYITASKTADNALKFDATASDNELKKYSYSGSDGFFGSNITITVNNYEALTRIGTDFQLERAGDNSWQVNNNPGYAVTLTALDGSDLDNGFYVELDGVRALTVTFDTPITSNGYVEFDIAPASGDYSFGFSDDEAEDSGLMAALGINTFLCGSTAGGIAVSDTIAGNKDYIAAAQIDADTGDFAVGDNTNALAIADLQYTSSNIAQWTCNRGSAKTSGNLTATVEGYYHSTVGSIGTRSASISRSKAFSEVMVNKLGEIRDSISGVSLDEEMTNLIKFQHAYAAAAKLISVSDEMFNTLLGLR